MAELGDRMRQVYSPANAAEAHMLAHLLDQAGIPAHVHGEALQGAVGELPAGGLIQLMVAEDHYDNARQLILKWEKTSVPENAESPRPGGRFRVVAAIVFLAVGTVAGWALKVALDNSQLTVGDSSQSLDQNGDGRDDATWFYRLGSVQAYKSEIDYNFDGRTDYVAHYDAAGTPTSDEYDTDFDGSMDARSTYVSGVLHRTELDTDRNEVPDVTQTLEHGVLVREEMIDHRYGTVAVVNNYVHGRLRRAEVDLDRDGFRETLRTFDRFGEITRTETRQSQ